VLGVLTFAVVVLTIPIGRAPIWEPNNARWGRTAFAYPDLSLEYDVYVHRRIVEIDCSELQRLLAEPARDVVILTRKR